jgi:hypothetical protein
MRTRLSVRSQLISDTILGVAEKNELREQFNA